MFAVRSSVQQEEAGRSSVQTERTKQGQSLP